MFDKTKVSDALYGLVGLKDSTNPDYAILDDDNQVSRSGRFATDNPYVKIEYLKDNSDYHLATDEEFNAYLLNLQKTSISEVLDQIQIDSDFIDRQVLYKNGNNKISIEALPTGFVGYEICKNLEPNQAIEITRCLLEFKGTGSITLLLYNSAKSTPIKSKLVTITSTFQTVQLNWRLDNSDGYFDGEFYFGYLTNGLTISPFDREYESAKLKSTITGVELESVSVNYTPNTNELFDLELVESSTNCWGLNPDISVFNDYTDLFIQNEMLFSSAICLQFQINCIQTYIASIRSNRNQAISEDQLNMVIAQLNGIPDRIVGLIPTFRKELELLSKELNKLKKGYFDYGFIINTRS